ncbi:hypothetical protein SAMN05660860_02996 [Geoalkalibacter ferrihydriticus]|uniref:Cadherin domain-containing protein n=2 Tax=Geoalkalibacter ferrihydriticus TaxID=392333 RepID=A0A0C2HLH0_9BACT|nr:hypothetical protein [Geoalkalibacter ferrihydriticus]KIH75845.1 hypothetical protein GFER_14785 [Geoalkalibacter ferrihydriticus DSM 17813]SDM67810.1 hypothetical protein SAMN05660860_02996 [Geoalkalibacter ferrihydriticus]
MHNWGRDLCLCCILLFILSGCGGGGGSDGNATSPPASDGETIPPFSGGVIIEMPGIPDNHDNYMLPPLSSRTVNTNMDGPITGLKATSDGGMVAIAEVSTGTNSSLVRFSKFSENGKKVHTIDLTPSPGINRPKVLIEESAQVFHVLGTTKHVGNGIGQLFLATINTGVDSDPPIHLLENLEECTINTARRASNGDLLIAGTDFSMPGDKVYANMLFARISTDGGVKWEHTFGDKGFPDSGVDILELSNRNIAFLGTTRSEGNSLNDADIFLHQVTADGEDTLSLWADSPRIFGKRGANLNEIALGLEETNDGFFIVGSTNSFGDNYDIIIIQTDTNGMNPVEELLGPEISHAFPTSLLKISGSEFLIAGAAQVPNKGFDAYLAFVDLETPANDWVRYYGGSRDELAVSVIKQDNGFLLSGFANGVFKFTSPTNFSLTEATAWLVDVNANGAVRPITIAIDSMEIKAGAPIILNLAAFFYDISGSSLTYVASSSPPLQSLQISGSTLTLTEAPDVIGPTDYSITLTATNEASLSTSQTFTLTVIPAGD